MSPIAQPESKGSQIIAKLNEMVESKDSDEFTLKKLKAEAEKLKKEDLATAFSVLGMIACIEKDIKNMHSYHKNALAYSNESPKDLTQYVVSLMNCQLYHEAYTYAKKANEKDPSDKKNLDMLIRTINELNLEDEFQKYIDKWFKITGKHHYLVAFIEDNDAQLSLILDEYENLLNNESHLIVKPDSKLVKLADDLVEGVEVK